MGRTKLNLGCGTGIKKDYINLDYEKGNGVDIVHDLNRFPYPFKDNQFEEIYASFVLEHLTADWFKIIRELYRILKLNGKLVVLVPHFSSATAYMENHVRFFRYRSFENFLEQPTEKALDQIKGYKFKILERKIFFIKKPLVWNILVEKIVNSSKSMAILYENTFLKALFPADYLMFVLKK
jgi:ubiquinone/menaquinone biosynthesis C-methylase UbiE